MHAWLQLVDHSTSIDSLVALSCGLKGYPLLGENKPIQQNFTGEHKNSHLSFILSFMVAVTPRYG